MKLNKHQVSIPRS